MARFADRVKHALVVAVLAPLVGKACDQFARLQIRIVSLSIDDLDDVERIFSRHPAPYRMPFGESHSATAHGLSDALYVVAHASLISSVGVFLGPEFAACQDGVYGR